MAEKSTFFDPNQSYRLEKAKPTSLTADAFRRLRRNKAAMIGAMIIAVNLLVAIFAPFIAPYDYDTVFFKDINGTPTWVTKIFPGMKPIEQGGYVKIREGFLLGADNLGRDLLSRIIYGARISLTVGIITPFINLTLGLLIGLLSGYRGGWLDNVIMRFVDIMYAFPTYLLIILLMSVFRLGASKLEPGSFGYFFSRLDASMGGLLFIFIGIGLTSWMNEARLARGQVLSVRENEYIVAAIAIGAPNSRIIFRHVLPNIIGPLIIAETLAIPSYIAYEAFLSFIGLGVNPPTPSWGGMIADGVVRIQAYPNHAIFPALALFILMFAFNFLGDGLRDAFDPTLRGRE
ncbi:MAG: Oligopeptide transport system permease protein OppC [Anaerolineae bacterium]|nr:MAG: Oligopeptide transport system permease protein OppC [Anaerolineae bacterium]